MNELLGLIDITDDKPLTEISVNRPVASQPFGGKYRVIDFTLSSMVNAGIGSIGLMLSEHSRSVLDHIRSAKEWGLARKQGGLYYLPPEHDEAEKAKGEVGDYYRNLRFVERSYRRYLIVTKSESVHNINFTEALHSHRQHDADVTLVYKVAAMPHEGRARVLEMDRDGRVTAIKNVEHVEKGDKLFLQCVLMDTDIFIDAIRKAHAAGDTHFVDDVIGKRLVRARVYGYEHAGYYAHINSIQEYFRANMDMLDYKTWKDLFLQEDRIHTKIKDEAPAKYMEESSVKNSLVANGCVVEGTVENSIIFRSVRVGKNAVVRNCIVMQSSVIGEDAQLDGVICDKETIIQPEAILHGSPEQPVCIAKYKVS